MRLEEKRPAPYTICLKGAPGHVDAVYMIGVTKEKIPYKTKGLC